MTLTPHSPLVQLTFYPDTILCTRYDGTGQTTYPVAAQDVAEAVADVPFTTGWLRPRTLCVERRGGVTTVAVHIPRARHRVHVETRTGDQVWEVPLPDLVFIGRGREYYVFATKRAPTPDTSLFHAPCSNVYDNGNLCPGNTPFPEAHAQTMPTAVALFLNGSVFTSHLAHNRVRGAGQNHVLDLWADLATRPRARFPLRALRPLSTSLARVLL